jgi:hypothetical protein
MSARGGKADISTCNGGIVDGAHHCKATSVTERGRSGDIEPDGGAGDALSAPVHSGSEQSANLLS